MCKLIYQERNCGKVAEEKDYIVAIGDFGISVQDEADVQPETNRLPKDDAEVAENVISEADAMVKETAK